MAPEVQRTSSIPGHVSFDVGLQPTDDQDSHQDSKSPRTPAGHRRDTGGTREGHGRDTEGTREGHGRDTGGTPWSDRPDTTRDQPDTSTRPAGRSSDRPDTIDLGAKAAYASPRVQAFLCSSATEKFMKLAKRAC